MRSTSRDWQCRHFAGIPPAEASGGTGVWQVHGLDGMDGPAGAGTTRRQGLWANAAAASSNKQRRQSQVTSHQVHSGQVRSEQEGVQATRSGRTVRGIWHGAGDACIGFWGAPGTTHHDEKQANQDQRDRPKSGQLVYLGGRRPLRGPADGQRADGRAVLSHRKSDVKTKVQKSKSAVKL